MRRLSVYLPQKMLRESCHQMYFEIHHRGMQLFVHLVRYLSSPFQDDDEEKINHRIPHRFEPLTNIGANWCCHCGYILPLGRKNARKCSECDITCHANCAHLVPDFCGMSMETANELLRNWRDINRARGGKAGSVAKPAHSHSTYGYSHTPTPTDSSATLVGDAVDRLKLTGPEVPPPDPFGRLPLRTPTPEKDPRAMQYQQPQPGYPNAQTQAPVSRPTPSAKPTLPPYDFSTTSPALGRPSYEQPPPAIPDAYHVRNLFFSLSTLAHFVTAETTAIPAYQAIS
jgi:hypothetical protein